MLGLLTEYVDAVIRLLLFVVLKVLFVREMPAELLLLALFKWELGGVENVCKVALLGASLTLLADVELFDWCLRLPRKFLKIDLNAGEDDC